jgi:hypothetical protein
MRHETASRVVQKLRSDWSIAIDSDKPVVAAVPLDGAILMSRGGKAFDMWISGVASLQQWRAECKRARAGQPVGFIGVRSWRHVRGVHPVAISIVTCCCQAKRQGDN